MVEKITISSHSEVETRICQKNPRPFIIKNISEAFIENFSDKKLLSLIGEAKCLVKDIKNKKQIKMIFSEFFVKLQAQYQCNNVNKQYTLQMGNILSKGFFRREKFSPFSNLLPFVSESSLFKLIIKKVAEINLWLDSGKNITRLHFDPVDNFLMLLEGTKTCYLVPKEDSQYLYMDERSPIFSNTSIVHLDLLKYPLTQNAKIIKIELLAGEVLYIPAGYWHEIVSHGLNKAINFWWQIPFSRKLAFPIRHFFIKDFLSRICFRGPCIAHTVAKNEIDEYPLNS